MAISSSQLNPVTRKGVKSGDAVEGLSPDAKFRRQYGIPPKGDKSAADSDWGFPIPPKGHPDAKAYAHAVLSRAHQAGNFKPEDVQKQIRKANVILYGTANPTDEDKRKSREAAAARVTEALKAYHGETDVNARRLAFAKALRAQREAGCITDSYFNSKDEVPVQLTIGLREAKQTTGGAWRSMLITEGPGNLGDRHWYTADVLTRAVGEEVFEGAQCFLDHPTEIEDRTQPERSVLKLGGWYSDVALSDYTDKKLGKVSAIFADLHPPVGNEKVLELLRTAVEYATRYPDKSYVGLSINALGVGEKAEINGEMWNRVDHLSEVVSVDIVTRAGARGKPIAFREAAKMATRAGKKPNREGSARSTNRAAAPKGAKAIREAARLSLLKSLRGKMPEDKRKLYESFTGFNRETQKKKLEEAGVDGSNVARILDELSDSGIEQLTGVHPDDIDDMDDDECEASVKGEEPTAPAGDGGTMDPSHGEAYGEDDLGEAEEAEEATEAEETTEAEEATEEADPAAAPIPKKAEEVKKALQSARKESAAKDKEIKDLRSKLKLAESGKRDAEGKVHTRLMEQQTSKVFEQLNIPDGMRKRLHRQIMERAHPNYNGYKPIKSAKDILEFVREEDLALRASSRDGMGVVANTGNGGVQPPNWKKAGF